ncbi:peptide ABC transporter permease [Cnuibacter physcomitrellae]|uniref:Peptide ABC transporter permease n=1 Tax=Cnuibacter physcomitrellae TaxID=1619308 RepID=A0A1X9LP27_9MICO|nr:ABC transporter permease [Cnuibacter physcomitrellae]ARJ06946.1 peptide ABC transporter permease [Cnuibacter physcomitrellae]MCS5497675.1 ABC transporter permease [Cnuibacter physcomitrellae]GGI39194.1 peptide ABC transporter permease [Cnuibacter physcomitrellae]
MSIALFVLRRFGRGLITIWFAVTVTFLLLRLLPGDPALAVASTNMTEDTRAALLSQYGLDQPLIVQYVLYLGQLVQGHLGTSFTQSIPVTDVLLQRLPWTLLLTITALVLTVLIGIPLGVLAASHKNRFLDRLVQVLGVTGQSLFVPSVGIVLLLVFGLALSWFPIGGAYSTGVYGMEWYGSVAQHLVLPVVSLTLIQLGSYVLTMRGTLIDALGEDYITLAKVNGLPYRRILWKHALRNALLPATTLIGLQLGFVVGGAVLTETVFAYPGIGRGIYEAVTQLDFPVLQGAFLLLAVTVVIVNMLTDIAYGFLDPRVKTS